MTDAQTEARAIVTAALPPHEQAILGHDAVTVLTDLIATALAAKDAELADFKAKFHQAIAVAGLEKERAEHAEAQLAEARKALEPFAKIKPSTACAEDGSEAEPYRVFLAARDDFDFTGADLAAARRALEAQEGK